MDTGFATGMRAIFSAVLHRRRVAARPVTDQVRKRNIMKTMKATTALPYFTSMMKPS
jgi:hypothetical protein